MPRWELCNQPDMAQWEAKNRSLLAEGWEPFAVTREQQGDSLYGTWFYRIWYKRQVREGDDA
jgi:hypothetical protein